MDYEKKYTEALGWMQSVYPTMTGAVKEDAEHYFPELKEMENERIRKSLIHLLQVGGYMPEEEKAKAFAWLKKQSNPNKEYWKGYKDGKKAILDKYSELKKQEEQKSTDKIQLGKKYKCIASPRYSTFMVGQIYKPEDKFLCSLMNFCYDCFELIEEL